MDKENKDNHTLRVFEAFAGIGAQASALDRMGINYKMILITFRNTFYSKMSRQ